MTLFKRLSPVVIALLTVAAIGKYPAQAEPTDYADNPFLPGDEWRVHDLNRPQPRVVTPGKTTAKAPSDAIVLFDGTDLDEWISSDGTAATWILSDDYMEVPPKVKGKKGNIQTKREFSDIQLHIEFATPNPPKGESQQRGNSGIFFMGSYEIQVLDCYENQTYPDGQNSALYGYKPPLVNACRPPGEFQTYDIVFEAPRWDEKGNLTKKAYVTVFHNGVLTHHRQAFLGRTSHKKVAKYGDPVEKGPIRLQHHGDPVRFRNIWVRELDLPDAE